MKFHTYGNGQGPTLLLIPGLGVSHEIFAPLVEMLADRFCLITVEVDGFVIGTTTLFTSIDDQAAQVVEYVQSNQCGHLDCAYGLSLGGKILSRVLERNELRVDHAILDAAPLLPLPRWLVKPLSYLQSANVWTCFHWTRFWRWVFRSHYFDVLLDECCKVYPWGGRRAVIEGYYSVYTNKLESVAGTDIHYWYGTLEGFVARTQVKHLQRLYPGLKVEVFKGLNHGQLLVDRPAEVAQRIRSVAKV